MARHLYSMFVGRLPNDTTEEELIRVFSECGEVKGVGIIPNHEMPFGYGFVQFAKVETVLKAVQEMGHWTLRGKMLNVEVAKSTKDMLRQNSWASNLSIKTVAKDNGDRARVKEACFIINKELDLISGDQPIDVVYLLTSLEMKPATFSPKLKGNACEGTCLTQASLLNSIGAFQKEDPSVRKEKKQKLSRYLSNLQSDLEIIRSGIVKKDISIQKNQDATELNTGISRTMNTSPPHAKGAKVGPSVKSLKTEAKKQKANHIENCEMLVKKNGTEKRNAEKENKVKDRNSDCDFSNLSEDVNTSVKSHICGERETVESRCCNHSDVSSQLQGRCTPSLSANSCCHRNNNDNAIDSFKNMLCLSVLNMLGWPGAQDGLLGPNMLRGSENNRMDISKLLGLGFGGPPETVNPSHHDHNHLCDHGHKSNPFQHQQKQFSLPSSQNYSRSTGMECVCCNNSCLEDHRVSAMSACSCSHCSSQKMSHSPCTHHCCRDNGMGLCNKSVHASHEQCHSDHNWNPCKQEVPSPLSSVEDKFCNAGCQHNRRSPDYDLTPMKVHEWNTSGFSSQVNCGHCPAQAPFAARVSGPAQTSASKLTQFCGQKMSVSDESNHNGMHISGHRNSHHSFSVQNSGVAELSIKSDNTPGCHTQSNGYSPVRCKEPVSSVKKNFESINSASTVPPRHLTKTPPHTMDSCLPPVHSSFSPIDSPMKTTFDKPSGTDAFQRPCLLPIVRKAARPYFNGPAHLLNSFNVEKTMDESVSSSDTPKSSSSSGQGEDILSDRDLSGKSSCEDEVGDMEMEDYQEKARVDLFDKLQDEIEGKSCCEDKVGNMEIQDYQEKARLALLDKLQAEIEESDDVTQDSDQLWYMYGKASIRLKDCGSPDKSSDSGISMDAHTAPLPASAPNHFQGTKSKRHLTYPNSAMSQKSDSDEADKIGDEYIGTKLPQSSSARDEGSKIGDHFIQTKLPNSSSAIGSQILEAGRGPGSAFSSRVPSQKSLLKDQMSVGGKATRTLLVRGRGKAILDVLKSQ